MRKIIKFIPSGIDIGNKSPIAGSSIVDALLEERKKMDVEIG